MTQIPRSPQALICVGEKDPDPAAIYMAEEVSKALGLEPVLLHVQRTGGHPQESAQLLEATQNSLSSEPERVIQVEGKFETQVLEELESEQFRLVVLGTSSHRDEALTDRAQHVAMHAADSVLLTHNASPEVNHILLCTGGHSESYRAVDWGLQLAESLSADLTILHVVTTTPSMYTGLGALEEGVEEVLSRETPLAQHLKEAAQRAEESGVNAKIELRHGMVAEEILRACEMEEYDLVVIGSPDPRALLNRLTLGRVAPQLLASTPISILIVRSAVEAPAEA